MGNYVGMSRETLLLAARNIVEQLLDREASLVAGVINKEIDEEIKRLLEGKLKSLADALLGHM